MSPSASVALGVSALAAMVVAPLARVVDLENGAPLRVCAAASDLPFSNDRRQGFENRIAELLAHELGRPLEYVWSVRARGFSREMLHAGGCDVAMGLTAGAAGYVLSRPYYRSAFVLVSAREHVVDLTALDDARVPSLTLALHVSADVGTNVPATTRMLGRDLVGQAHRFLVYGDDNGEDRIARLIDAVTRGEVDGAIVWGPLASSIVKRHSATLTMTPITAGARWDAPPLLFDVSVGVRRSDPALAARVDAALDRRATDIQRILAEYDVPVLGGSEPYASATTPGETTAAAGAPGAR